MTVRPPPTVRVPLPAAPPARPPRFRRLVSGLSAAYLASVVVAAVSLRWADDAILPTLLAFGPRWALALPLAALIPAAVAVRSRRSGLALAAAALVFVGPVAGGTVSVGPLVRSSAPGPVRLRVASWNTGGVASSPAQVSDFERLAPDVLLIQEGGGAGGDHALPGLPHHAEGPNGLRILSRHPVRHLASLNQNDLGAWGGAARFIVATPAGDVSLVNVHLPTIRYGLEDAIGTRFQRLSGLREAIAVRAAASRAVADWVGGDDQPGLIVAGDFNTPAESAIFRADWGRFGDAYSAAGTGWGLTKWTKWFGVRIDHVLYTRPWVCRAVRVGEAYGSDHRVLVADLELEDW